MAAGDMSAGPGAGAGGPGAGAGGPGGAPAEPSPSAQQVTGVMDRFRPLAETLQQLGRAFPEGQEEAVTMMKSLQSWMAKVAGNPQRTSEAQAPPVA